MALCKAVAEAHGGGDVSLGDAPDGGALFRLALHTA
jgi:signal transduction histidine kinase